MLRTPSFGDDSYELMLEHPDNFNFTDELLKNSKIADVQVLPTISSADISELLELSSRNHEHSPSNISSEVCTTSSAQIPTVFSQLSHSFQTSSVKQLSNQFSQRNNLPATSVQSSLLSRMMSVPRDSILESLESIAPKFPPQDVDLPDISATNDLQTSSAVSSGFTTAQMYGQTNITTMSQIKPVTNDRETTPDGSHGTTGSPTGSSVSNVSNRTPPQESSEDSDDSVPLAQV